MVFTKVSLVCITETLKVTFSFFILSLILLENLYFCNDLKLFSWQCIKR